MTNRVTLKQLDEMPEIEAASIHISQLAMLLEDVAEMKAMAMRYADRLSYTIGSKYGAIVADMRHEKGVDTGTVRVVEDGYVVIADQPKSVSWDQEKLAAIETRLKNEVSNISEYIKTKREVEERKFSSWPLDLSDVFLPARTVRAGKQTYKIETSKKEAK